MGKVQDSFTRLEDAIARLELAARRKPDGKGAASADHASLAVAADAVAVRLDAMIGRIDRVLEG